MIREVREEVLSRPGRYAEIHPGGRNERSLPLKVKEVSMWMAGMISSSTRERFKRNPDMTANGFLGPIPIYISQGRIAVNC
jgi:hypothetical protein